MKWWILATILVITVLIWAEIAIISGPRAARPPSMATTMPYSSSSASRKGIVEGGAGGKVIMPGDVAAGTNKTISPPVIAKKMALEVAETWDATKEEMIAAALELFEGFEKREKVCGAGGVSTVREIRFCKGMLARTHEESGEEGRICTIYIFGVANYDRFTKEMGKLGVCKVYAFDPTITEGQFVSMGYQGVDFHPWGLRGGVTVGAEKGDSWQHTLYGNVTGKLFTLKGIQDRLGHGAEIRIAYLRADCEGCEWGWISEALREDPSVFRRIDQMFLEVHFATTLRFDDTALSLAPTLRSAIVQHFVVGWSDYNLGMRVDRHRLPAALVTAGANKKACCREFFLINKRHVSSGLA